MRIRKFGVLLGLAMGPALGAALALSPEAIAAETPVDAWPSYLQDYYPSGNPTNVVGPDYDQTYDQALHVTDPGGGTFSTHVFQSDVPTLYTYSSQDVFDSVGLAPPDGTTIVQYGTLDAFNGFEFSPLLIGGSEDAPGIGSLTSFDLFGFGFGYVSDTAGIEGYLESPEAITPLFIIPASDATAAALSGAGSDGFSQLLAELGTLF